ncbi:hypothetical protein PBI_SUZY_41 [Gordonia phage Suzy]|uniref:Uncharacterized protein n=1 Tax=Gordonia phage Suzy TaxID=2201430 RepID=A0A2Z4Q7T3_9CAUD|nr:hypothetical protein HOT44_gp41 [Gordonia phage Suzy]AWY06146.1 hypothetical protein PBI_SUZY_41 [Gordonia phage Suzy]
MTEAVVDIEFPMELSNELLDSILVTAFDGDVGGSNYWLAGAEVSIDRKDTGGPYSYTRWVAVDIKYTDSGSEEPEDEDDELHEFRLDAEAIARGLRTVIKRKREDGKPSDRAKHVLEALVTNDGGMIDADDADLIVQYAVFGKAVFG